MQRIFKRTSSFIALLLILTGISFILFYQSAELLTQHKHNTDAFNSLFAGWDNYLHFKVAWRGRLFSNALAAIATRAGISILSRTDVFLINTPMELSASLWTSGWFFAIGLIYIWSARQRSLFYIFGIFTALSFGYLTRVTNRIYPWDMPALFTYVLFTILFVRKQYKWIMLLLPIAMGFKETALLLCLGFLLTDLPNSQKIKMTVLSAGMCISVKLIIDFYVQVPIPFFTMQPGLSSSFTRSHLAINLDELYAITPYLINAGTLLTFLILPIYDKNVLSFKLIAILFIIGNFVFGVISEYRIWFEMIPFALYSLERFSYGNASLQPQQESLSNLNAQENKHAG